MQTSLNLSLARVLHVYGDHIGLLADTRIPPLQLTTRKHVHLAQLHFRLTITRPDTLPALLFKKLNSPFPLSNLHTSTLDYHIRYTIHAIKIDLQTGPLPHMASQPPKNRERSFRSMIRKFMSDLWNGQLYIAAHTHAGQSPRRKASYIQITNDDLQRLELFKPAQFLRIPHNQLPLLRLRTQATSYISTHLHLSNTHTYTPYAERYCFSCPPLQFLGNETHTLLRPRHSNWNLKTS